MSVSPRSCTFISLPVQTRGSVCLCGPVLADHHHSIWSSYIWSSFIWSSYFWSFYIGWSSSSYMVGGGLNGYVKSKPLGNGQIISIDVLVIVMIIAVFHKKLIWPPVRALSKLKRHLLDLTLWTTVLWATTSIDRWRHICVHLSFQ